MNVRIIICLLSALFTVVSHGEETNTPPSTATKKKVKLLVEVASTVSYSVREKGEDGEMHLGPPSERVQFGEGIRKQHAIKAVVGDKTLTCPVLYQDVVYFIENGKRAGRVGVSWYGGCPFNVDDSLSVTSNLEMRVENTIEIEDADESVLFVAPTSARPIIMKDGRIFTGCETFRNVVWLFKKPGIKFRAKDVTYLVTKSGATIRFSATGVEMNGIEKTK